MHIEHKDELFLIVDTETHKDSKGTLGTGNI